MDFYSEANIQKSVHDWTIKRESEDFYHTEATYCLTPDMDRRVPSLNTSSGHSVSNHEAVRAEYLVTVTSH